MTSANFLLVSNTEFYEAAGDLQLQLEDLVELHITDVAAAQTSRTLGCIHNDALTHILLADIGLGPLEEYHGVPWESYHRIRPHGYDSSIESLTLVQCAQDVYCQTFFIG